MSTTIERARDEVLAAARRTATAAPLADGLGASRSRVSDAVALSVDAASAETDEPVVLVRPQTSPENVHGMSVSTES